MQSYPEELRQKALQLIATGMHTVEIAEVCGVSATTVRRWKNPAYHTSVIQAHNRWKVNNPERMAMAQRNWRRNSPEKAKAKDQRKYRRDYAKRPGKFHARAALYRARKRSVPGPANKIERLMCENYYILAKELTEQTWVLHHVDHIWPISKGGPHLPWNLRVVTAQENPSKGANI